MNSKAMCYTFYSYKGGSGRSTTCVNTLLHLIRKMKADPRHPILLVDTDLESAGLTYFFNCKQKFTSTLSGTIDAASLLSDGFEGTYEAWIYGKDLHAEAKPVSQDIIRDLEGCGVSAAQELFGDILLYPQERALLNGIVSNYVIQKTSAGNENPEAPKKAGRFTNIGSDNNNQAISRYCNMSDVLEVLRKERDPDVKRKLLIDRMPATRFVDISAYFASLPGTVLFLGVDLNYQKEQVVRNSATSHIDTMLKLAAKYGYRAVLFDSSAGVQSTAHALQWKSDVIVYCMRPSRQFIMGTDEQIKNYQSIIIKKAAGEKKPIILLPTVVPSTDEYHALRAKSFNDIKDILLAKSYLKFIDPYFCTSETALNEISFFKWREQILGVPDINAGNYSPEIRKAIESVSSEEGVNARDDTRRAYQVYTELAEHLLLNSDYQIVEEQ